MKNIHRIEKPRKLYNGILQIQDKINKSLLLLQIDYLSISNRSYPTTAQHSSPIKLALHFISNNFDKMHPLTQLNCQSDNLQA